MSLIDLASLGSFVSGIAVLISLIYLALQISQNAKHTRALIQQGRITGIIDQYLAMAATDLAAAYIVGNGGSATPEEIKRRQFFLECTTFQVRFDDTFTQHQEGLVNDDQFNRSCRHMVGVLREPGVRKFFGDIVVRENSADVPTKFQTFIKELLAKAGNAPDGGGSS